MPYIKQIHRKSLEPFLETLIQELESSLQEDIDGKLNYVISKMLHRLYDKKYFDLNRAMGVLNCITHEYYRKTIAPYEETKIIENGDI